MRTRLRRIGNSRGILVPAALIAACELGRDLELTQEGKALVIRSAGKPREGWFATYRPALDSDAWARLPVDDGLEEWTW